MSFADTSATRLAYIAEATENTIPSTPTWLNLRYTSESLAYNKQTVQSDEIRADRNVSDLVDVGYGVGGEVGFEMSYGTLDSLLESVLFSTWNTNVLKNGITPKTFAFEKTFETGSTDNFLRFTGCQVGSMSLNIAARELITGSMTVLGRGHSTDTAIVSGATYTAANTKAVMSASGDVGSLSMDNVSPTPTLMTATLNIENNLREKPQIGSRANAGIGAGRCVITGSIEAYFEDQTLYSAFVDHDDVGLTMTLGSVTAEKYTIEIPKAKLSNGLIVAGGNDQDVMATFDFTALYDTSGSPANNCSIIITRAVS